MKIQARIDRASTDAKTGEAFLTLRTSDKKVMPMLPYLQDKELSVNLDIGSKKRSLSANNYAWVLIDKLSQHTRISKKDIYRATIRDIGGVSLTGWYDESEVPKLREVWESNGDGWMLDELDTAHGKIYVALYYGSSCYDVKQMQRLIEELQYQCSTFNISYATPDEVSNMLSLWSTA